MANTHVEKNQRNTFHERTYCETPYMLKREAPSLPITDAEGWCNKIVFVGQ